SVSLTSIVTLASAFITPLSFFFWAMFLPHDGISSATIDVSLLEMLKTVVLIILIPLILGILFQRVFPKATRLIKQPIGFISILVLIAFIVVALADNSEYLIG